MQDILEENSSHDLQMVRFTAGDPLFPVIGEVDDTSVGNAPQGQGDV